MVTGAEARRNPATAVVAATVTSAATRFIRVNRLVVATFTVVAVPVAVGAALPKTEIVEDPAIGDQMMNDPSSKNGWNK
jgi:hypothetical protein